MVEVCSAFRPCVETDPAGERELRGRVGPPCKEPTARVARTVGATGRGETARCRNAQWRLGAERWVQRMARASGEAAPSFDPARPT